ncbi:hypothetical protein IFT59_07150 [Rhizobium sp. CFBP 8752]|uniref:hypothetical protein n=1 Tax=Rhizobium sp. CFBP 8752 TaxID=2775301 RepID=UPI001783E6A1|nr:hypothetical protein [Rhizobium sp. CFBP 8752]MBD8663028.1 hypothetical protein [Rhizobium sp. CFBP 8752]
MRIALQTSLSKRETYLIGSIVSQWGYLEADIFEQTLVAMSDLDPLPKAMSNTNFGLVLDLWLERVAEPKDDERRAVLKAQYDMIQLLTDFRQAVVHSRWEWNANKPDEVVAVRAKKKELIRATFTINDLIEMDARIGEIRYLIRYPSEQDRADELADDGIRISRSGWEMLFGQPTVTDETGDDP